MRIDLHLHTTWSDGRRSPLDLAREVGKRRLTHWAVTDHDSCAALAELDGLPGLIAGCELTCWAEGREVHIVGLGVEPGDATWQAFLAAIQAARWRRIAAICDWLGRHRGWQVDPQTCRPDGGVVTRSHLARQLVAQGLVPHVPAAFAEAIADRHLGALGPPGYPDPAAGAAAIRAAGGVAILAHPGHYRDIHLVERLLKTGLDGLEIKHPGCTPPTSRLFRALADRHGLLRSCGSDDHGGMPCRIGDWRLSGEEFRPLLERIGPVPAQASFL